MMRIISGTLTQVGLGKLSVTEFEEYFKVCFSLCSLLCCSVLRRSPLKWHVLGSGGEAVAKHSSDCPRQWIDAP